VVIQDREVAHAREEGPAEVDEAAVREMQERECVISAGDYSPQNSQQIVTANQSFETTVFMQDREVAHAQEEGAAEVDEAPCERCRTASM
jgi:hypothetical protein